MKSELLILWAEKVSGAAICNLGEAIHDNIFKTLFSIVAHK
jgi:hypothetical protein